MSTLDFDDIFGEDSKMDVTSAPSLTTDINVEDFFGDSSDKLTKHGEPLAVKSPQDQANWEQDDFLSWLDDDKSTQPSVSETPISSTSGRFSLPPIPVPRQEKSTLNESLFDDDNDFERMLNETGKAQILPISNRDNLDHILPTTDSPTPAANANTISHDEDDDLEQIVRRASNHPFDPVVLKANTSISLDDDDDDDDDDDLEQIIQRATKQANVNTAQEKRNSSLQIKSQVQPHHKTQFVPDVEVTRQTYLETGKLPVGSRLTMWKHAIQPTARDSASMYAVQTTPCSLPSQELLRKEIETLCSQIFASAAHERILHEGGDSLRGSHVLFIDSAEILFTHLCTRLESDYHSGMALPFAPLLLASGCEPLHPDIVETLAAMCRRFLPHIGKPHSLGLFTTDRRPVLKRLLFYHAPQLASHLDHEFPTWHHAPRDEQHDFNDSGAIPDSWLASLFESEGIGRDPFNFDLLLKVWDCSLMLEVFSSSENAPLTTGCFITLFSIVTAEKTLIRMKGEQLRHCMATTLLETLLHGKPANDQVFVQGIRHLMNATPSSISTTLRHAGLPQASIENHVKSTEAFGKPGLASSSNSNSSINFGMNTLLSASTQGLKDVSNMVIDVPVKLMIDMPGKLFTMVPLNPIAALSSASSSTPSLTDSPETQQLFYMHVQAMKVASVSVTLEPREVVPLIFGGIQGHGSGSLRYFIVDCRGVEEMRRGQIPTAFHLDPTTVSEPHVLDQILATLEPLKGAGVHICVMGHGYAHIAEELYRSQQERGVAASSPFYLSEGFLETYANDQTRTQATVEFLLKHEFPRVSVLDGGYAAAHGYLFRSQNLTVDDLADHDMPNCKLCQHDRSMETGLSQSLSTDCATHGTSGDIMKANPSQDISQVVAKTRSESLTTRETSLNTALVGSLLTDINLSPPLASPKSPPAGSYYSNFAGAIGKTLLSPTMDGTKWLLKKSATTTAEFANAAANLGNRTGSMQGAVKESKTFFGTPLNETKTAIPKLNRLRNSLVAIGSESLDMLKKVESAMEQAVEQAAVATTGTSGKVRVPFPSTISPTSKNPEATTVDSPLAMGLHSAKSIPPVGQRTALSSDPTDRNFVPQSKDEMFTIDDEDEEDNEGHFVQDIIRSDERIGSILARDAPFVSGNNCPPALHEVVKGNVKALAKGMLVSRKQMAAFASSPFFACYKKKPPAGTASSSTTSVHTRRVVVMENHLVVLQAATRSDEDRLLVKSCHALSHITRMTCLKKNALMVSIYYKWKAEDGEIVERRNSYEVQQRDEFIKAVKTTMEKMGDNK